MQFVVFSFNRGEFLRNCVASLERCAPWSTLTVVDDDSSDPGTREVLSQLSRRHRVLRPGGGLPHHKHGGFYQNVQATLDQLDHDAVYCFLQDDMQAVRRLSEAEAAAFSSYFDAVDKAGFIHPAFMKGCNRSTDAPRTRLDGESDGYLVDRLASSAGAFYSDVHIAKAGSLHAAGWRFMERESLNEQQARLSFRQMSYLRNPFVAWLPNPPAWRGRRQTWALRAAHRKSNAGLYPYREFSDEENDEFRRRPRGMLPFAEDFLSVDGTGPEKPWRYYPLQGRRVLKLLDSAESRLRRALRNHYPG